MIPGRSKKGHKKTRSGERDVIPLVSNDYLLQSSISGTAYDQGGITYTYVQNSLLKSNSALSDNNHHMQKNKHLYHVPENMSYWYLHRILLVGF